MQNSSPENLLPDWLVLKSRGLYCPPGDFYLDPRSQVQNAVVSHAHADHYPRGLNQVWCTPATHALAAVRYKKAAGKKVNTYDFHAPFKIGPIDVRFLPAGHMLGSAQILMTYQSETVLFSGDFHLTPNPSCHPLTYPEEAIDLMICESTFGEKSSHPDPHDRFRELVEEARGRPLLIGSYVLGKAQRMHLLIKECFPEMEVFLNPAILKFSRVYEKFGFMETPLQYWKRQIAKRLEGNYAYLLPPRMLSSYNQDHSWFKVFPSGWDRTKKYFYLDQHLEISDHASRDEIMEYIQKIGPKRVLFHHGYPEPLIQACKMLKIQSNALHLQSQ